MYGMMLSRIYINYTTEYGPGILNCPRDIRVVSSQSSVEVHWLEPQFQPNENPEKIKVMQTHRSGQKFTVPSQNTVKYQYTSLVEKGGRTTECMFIVETVKQGRWLSPCKTKKSALN